MTVDPQHPSDGADPAPGAPHLPTFAEQVSQQLGGWRGMVEAGIPVSFFVVVNWVWSLRPALAVSVAAALLLALVRTMQGRPVRYAVNGLIGIAIGAVLALRSGEARDFYLPGILVSYGYAAVMVGSVVVRHPLVGWLWSVMFTGGRSDWRHDPVLRRTLTWLTLVWALVWCLKVTAQLGLYLADLEHALGVARIVLGAPVFALMLALTIWIVQRVQRRAVATV
ncbi:MAG TPA: DUF3159 domain-containing protein [Natronosporangium sp.]|nr:DUF3159 domain-containing protein [Natronosporangium sp.]